ncbi:Uncharacterised protein [Bordetella pertussis]|nr:Uncharacterised protein [Bordetella pertussis]
MGSAPRSAACAPAAMVIERITAVARVFMVFLHPSDLRE